MLSLWPNSVKQMEKFKQILSILTCFLMIIAVSLRRDGKWLGHQLGSEQEIVAQNNDTLRTMPDGTIVINTTGLGKDYVGYAGSVPLDIYIRDGRIDSINVLQNHETPGFMRKVKKGLLHAWDGLTLDEASSLKVDAISGATFTSEAIIGNMRQGLQYIRQTQEDEKWYAKLDLSLKGFAGLIVALMAATLPLIIKDKRYRLFQLVLNVVVLGFWCGSFISYAALLAYASNGMNLLALIVPLILLITAFIYPLFGKKSYYCTHICPFGSLQELAGKCTKYNLKMKPQTIRHLDTFRQVLWAVLMLCLWTGLWFDWIDYEPFSAFIFESASWIVITIAVTFVLLSTVVARPYCRFVCPTGTLFKIAQSSK